MIDVLVPKWGLTVEEAIITEWLVKVGDRVEAEQPLLMVETDKVDAEIPSPAPGTVAEIKFAEGDRVEPGWVIAVLDPTETA